MEGLAIPHTANMPAGVVTISAGLATFQAGEAKGVDTILQEADAALYRAEGAGRNRVAV